VAFNTDIIQWLLWQNITIIAHLTYNSKEDILVASIFKCGIFPSVLINIDQLRTPELLNHTQFLLLHLQNVLAITKEFHKYKWEVV